MNTEQLEHHMRTIEARIKEEQITKYNYIFVLQGNYGYGHGWEDLTAADTWNEIRGYHKDYRENEPNTPLRTIKRRELNPDWKGANETPL